MKQLGSLITSVALMLTLGVASLKAENVAVTLSFSGTSVSSPIDLQPGAVTSQYDLTGTGTLGPFAFRTLEATTVPPGACPGINHSYTGAGVFRFDDGSLLMVSLTQGSDCLQFTSAGPVAHCTRTFQIAGGSGRFKNVSGGTISMTETVLAVLFDASSNPVFFAATGEMTGTISGLANAAGSQDAQQ